MTQQEIKSKIEELFIRNELLLDPAIATLNPEIRDNLDKINKLQQECSHEYRDGCCIYCYKQEDNE